MQVNQQVQQKSTLENVKLIIKQYDWQAKLSGDYKDWMYAILKYFIQPYETKSKELVLDQLMHYAEMHKLPQIVTVQKQIKNCLSTPKITFQQLKLLVLNLQDLENAVTSLKNNTKGFQIKQVIDLDEQVKHLIINHDGTKLLVIGDTIKIFYKDPNGQWSVGPVNRRFNYSDIRQATINKDFTILAAYSIQTLYIFMVIDGVLKCVQQQKYGFLISYICLNEESTILGIIYLTTLQLFRFFNYEVKQWYEIRHPWVNIDTELNIFAFRKQSNLIATDSLHSVLLWKFGRDNTYHQIKRLVMIKQRVISLQFHQSSRQLIANTASNTIYTWNLSAKQEWKLTNIIKFAQESKITISIPNLELVILEKKQDKIVIWKQTQQKQLEECVKIDEEVQHFFEDYNNNYRPTRVINQDFTELVQSSKVGMLIFKEPI